jgi:predicted nucleotidyltransferase
MIKTVSSYNDFGTGITANMKSAIKKELENLEKQDGFTILFACESGSRAWGFPSRDSDYDVRFIYIHPQNRYLSIEDKKDHLEIPITDNLDINGWDIRKALSLLWRSNATLFEWLQSPIIYCSRHNFRDELFQLAKEYFSIRDTMNHYLGLTKKSLLSNPGENEIGLKQYFYILRPLLAAVWMVKYREIPPMEFHHLLQLIETPKLCEHIDGLLKKKHRHGKRTKSLLFPKCKNLSKPNTKFAKKLSINSPFLKRDLNLWIPFSGICYNVWLQSEVSHVDKKNVFERFRGQSTPAV